MNFWMCKVLLHVMKCVNPYFKEHTLYMIERRCLLGVAYWAMPTMRCLLGIAYWALPTGHCLLGIAYWALNQEKEEFFDQLFTESQMTKETYEMIEDFLSEETQMYNYTDDEINLTEQDRQEATQLLKEIT